MCQYPGEICVADYVKRSCRYRHSVLKFCSERARKQKIIARGRSYYMRTIDSFGVGRAKRHGEGARDNGSTVGVVRLICWWRSKHLYGVWARNQRRWKVIPTGGDRPTAKVHGRISRMVLHECHLTADRKKIRRSIIV